jgi:amidase
VFHTSTPAAVAGYPSVTVPAGEVAGLPVGLSFTGPRGSEPRLLALAYAFEQADRPGGSSAGGGGRGKIA